MPKSTARVARNETEWSRFFTKSSKRRGAILLDSSNPPAKKFSVAAVLLFTDADSVRLEGVSSNRCHISGREDRNLFSANTAKTVRYLLRVPPGHGRKRAEFAHIVSHFASQECSRRDSRLGYPTGRSPALAPNTTMNARQPK